MAASSVPASADSEHSSVTTATTATSVDTNRASSAEPSARMSMLASVLPTRQDAQVLSQFALVQRVTSEVVSDLGKLNLLAPRRLSLRKSVDENLSRAQLEDKIRANLLYIEVRRQSIEYVGVFLTDE